MEKNKVVNIYVPGLKELAVVGFGALCAVKLNNPAIFYWSLVTAVLI